MSLMVKRYQPAIARDALICLDLYQDDYGRRERYTATELAIVVAASLANHIIVREGLPVGLLTQARDPLIGLDLRLDSAVVAASGEGSDSELTSDALRETPGLLQGVPLTPELPSAYGPGERPASASAAGIVRFALPPRTGRGHLMSVLEVLARVQAIPAGEVVPGIRAPFIDLLRQATTSLSWGATITIVTGRETQELIDALFYLRRAGYAVALVLVQPGLSSEGLGRSERLNVPVYRVWQEQDLEFTVGAPRGHTTSGGQGPTSSVGAWRQRQ
jgi:uncharacterized protein (DUF58 family)